MERATNFQVKREEPNERAKDSRSVLELSKTGHQSKDCWAGHNSNRVQDNRVDKGNDVQGKSGKGGGKKGKSKDAGALAWNQQTGSPVASSVTSSAPRTATSTTVGTIDTIERTALVLCATIMAQQEIVNPRWIAFNCGHWSWRKLCGR